MGRIWQQHRSPILLFGLDLLLLAASQLCLRRALAAAQPSAGAILAALGHWSGLLGLLLLLAALLVWLLVLARYQLSFFYPLWGCAAVVLALAQWALFDGAAGPKTLFGALLVATGAGLLMRGGHSA